MANNPLIPKTICTYSECGEKRAGTYSGVLSFVKEKIKCEKGTYYVAFLFNEVIIGIFNRTSSNGFIAYEKDGGFIEPKYLKELRVFNADEELYLWRKEEGYFGYRHRIDDNGINKDNRFKQQNIVESNQVLWGTKCDGLKDDLHGIQWCKVSEERGIKLILPFSNSKLTGLSPKERICLLTRHYIDYNENGQAGYVDARMAGFTFKEVAL
jgi:CRISPR-associated protein (TIGR03984 family)